MIAYDLLLGIAALPFIYYSLAIYGTLRFFSRQRPSAPQEPVFAPPVSCFKPVRGLDTDAYENFASFCRQDYPEYEILFCVDDNDPAFPVIQKVLHDHPDVKIRILNGPDHFAVNDKVARLDRLSKEASYDVWVLSDSDVRVTPDYLRTVVAPLQNSKTGGVTCFYVAIKEDTFTEKLQEMGMMCDFFPGILVAWLLDGVKFGFGQTIVTTRARIEGFGGFRAIENRPADDLLVCRFVTEQGFEVELLPYTVHTTPDFGSMKELLYKRTRWMTVLRHTRPWGHLGLIFTFGLPWSLLVLGIDALDPSLAIGLSYVGVYFVVRVIMTWLVGARGLKQQGLWKRMLLIPIWDATAFAIWLVSFARRTIRWRGVDYTLKGGLLTLANAERGNASPPANA